jgi:hypothetical protein
MEKKKVSMIYINKNGVDGIKINSKDPIALQTVHNVFKEIKLVHKVNKFNLFTGKYTIDQLYECLLRTHDIIDWRLSSGLIDRVRNLMPVSAVPNDWILKNIVEHSLQKPRPYQIKGINQITRCPRKGFILNDDFGVGKTLQAVLSAKFFQKTLGRVSIFCPPYLIKHWELQIENICPNLDYEICNFNKKISNNKILIIDEAHLLIGTKKRRAQIKLSCRSAKKVIALTGMDFSENEEEFGSLLSIIEIEVSKNIIRNNFHEGVSSFMSRVPDLISSYLRRTKNDVELLLVKHTVVLEMEPKFKKITEHFRVNSDFSIKELSRMLELCSMMKLTEVIRYVLDARKSGENIKIAIYSQFPKILNSLRDRISDSVIYHGDETGHSVKLYLSSIYKGGITLDCDVMFILDTFLESTSNTQLESRAVQGIITKFIYNGGIDELVADNSKYASLKRNLDEVKRKGRRPN